MLGTLLQSTPPFVRRGGAARRLGGLAAIGTAVCLAAASPARAGDPHLVWKTIETEHFVIHYYEPLDDVAQHVARSAEYSHSLLSPVFGHRPEEKTQVVITDETDGSNGFASVLPRNAIRLFASAPSFLSGLNDHDDWLFVLTAHEYTHILHLDSISGLPRLYNKVFGKTWAPNQIQPRWVIEGIATFQESKRTSGGRTRSALFHMELRAATLADERLELDAVSNGPRAWPRGNAAYLYGSHFLEYVFDRYGEDKLRDLTWLYGSTPVPFGLNHAARRITGHDFEQLYADWLEHLRARYSVELEAIERAGLRTGRRLTFSADVNIYPRYTRDGEHIVWRQSDGYSESRFRVMPVGGNVGRASDYVTLHRVGRYDVLSDGSLIVERTVTHRGEYEFNDLHRWDRRTGRIERLTHALRVRDPAVSFDEQHVAFVINGASQTQLAVMPLERGARPRILWSGERFDQAGTPAWSRDGKYVAFSAWTAGGYRDLMIADVASGTVERLTHDRASDVSPVFSPDGAYIFYSSDRSGIYNIYAHERATGAVHQVSNVIGGALWPDVSPDGALLVYQGFGPGGYDLYEMALDRDRWIEPLPYVDDRPAPISVPEDVQVSEPRPYRALPTLAPQSYVMELSSSSFGTSLDLRTGGSDAAGLHGYALGASVGLQRGDINFVGSYSYSGWWPSLRVIAARTASLRSGVVLDGMNTAYTHDAYSFTSSVGLPVLRTDEGAGQLSFNYSVDWLRNTEDLFDQPDPGDTVPRYPEVDVTLAGAVLRWSYSDVRGYAYTVGPQAGQSFSAAVRLNHPSLGSDRRSLDLSYSWQAYKKLPWGETPVLALRLAGGVRTSDRDRTPLFVLGGAPNQDIVTAVINNLRVGSTGYLRGYEPRTVFGEAFQLANLEYRQLLYTFERGLSTLPIYVRRLHVAGLLDAGDAWSDEFDASRLKLGVGAAVRLDLVLGYYVPGSLELGYARGLVNDGIGEYWTLLTGTL